MRSLLLGFDAQPLFHNAPEASMADAYRASRREKRCGSGVVGRLEAFILLWVQCTPMMMLGVLTNVENGQEIFIKVLGQMFIYNGLSCVVAIHFPQARVFVQVHGFIA